MDHETIRRFYTDLPRCPVAEHDCMFMVKSPGLNRDYYCIRCNPVLDCTPEDVTERFLVNKTRT